MTAKIFQDTGWHYLTPIWQGKREIIQQGLPHSKLAPTWQILLLGDGSPTRHLQLLTGERTEVDLIEMSNVGMDSDNAPEAIQLLPGPRVRRQVWLRTASGQRLAYATSWWPANYVDRYLQNRKIPIWSSLSGRRTELYREIWGIHYGKSAFLESAFNHTGAFWGRYYLFWHQGKPITLIYEVFSPYLRKYLGSETIASPYI
ncbi:MULTISPECIES: chorismate lyase [Calothrix]|uniref:Chorismate lyase n=2 Tax=Calothrix TaxID=1186 RepID=A0ABR8A720_9CYAN|nr:MULTISPECIES: chorismate lyase [Calothrix]MBD2194861.1 chorismate lyase [Calothrix parietina FACHB-288]MBD2223459.1 chorismate lyase [Calothrix anomala FACHB-343]